MSSEQNWFSSKNGVVKMCVLRSLLIFTVLCGAVCGRRVMALENQPNIILFVSDDHGIDALGCYGNPVIKTPHLDRLANEGVR